MERIGYIMFFTGVIGLALLFVYGVYMAAGIIPALVVLFFELISCGIILTVND